jgi:hypothetical protein
VGESIEVGHIFDRDIIGHDELFQPGAEGFPQGRVGLDPKGIGGGTDSAIGFEPAFGGDDGGSGRLPGLEFL